MIPLPRAEYLLAFLLAGLVTYGFRAGGLALAARLPRHGRLQRALAALPGCILAALVAPSILAAGPWGILGAGITALVAWRSKNAFWAMLAGMAVVVLQRRLGW